MGQAFLDAGVPIVIAVNAEAEICDDACKIFSASFYTSLLRGNSVVSSFANAKRKVQQSGGDYDACCCAHKHDDDCLWYKYYQKNPKEAHEIHSGKCACPELGLSRGKRVHLHTCEALIRFKRFMSKLQMAEVEERRAAETTDHSRSGGLAALLGSDSDVDDSERDEALIKAN